jgi:hypothetical protein
MSKTGAAYLPNSLSKFRAATEAESKTFLLQRGFEVAYDHAGMSEFD